MEILNSHIDDVNAFTWTCTDCAETKHEVLSETVTVDGGQYYIDTKIRCAECGQKQEISEATIRDPR